MGKATYRIYTPCNWHKAKKAIAYKTILGYLACPAYLNIPAPL